MADDLEPDVEWMVALMLSDNIEEHRVAFVNQFEEASKRLGHERAVAAMDEAARRCVEIAGPIDDTFEDAA